MLTNLFLNILANFSDEVVQRLPKAFPCGVYYGWANVGSGDVHKMVMSIGFNPQFQNETKTIVRRMFIKYLYASI